MLKTIFTCFLLVTSAYAQEEFPNPVYEFETKPRGGTIRTATWNLGGKGIKELGSLHPFTKVKPKVNAELALELMKNYGIDIMCLNNVSRKKFKTGNDFVLEPAGGSVIFEGTSSSKFPSYYFMPGGPVIEKFETVFTYKLEYSPIIVNTKKITCFTPIPNMKPTGMNSGKKVHYAACLTKKEKFRFNFTCSHFDEDDNDLRRFIWKFDEQTIKPPLSKTATIHAGDFNSYPLKHKAPGNPNAKETKGWFELEMPMPKNISPRPIQGDGITFTKIGKRNGILKPLAISSDILHSRDLDILFRGKSVIPVQVFPLNPKGKPWEVLPTKQWEYFWKFSDHLPVKADYKIPQN